MIDRSALLANPARPTYVLVPGAGGSAWYWHRLVAELEQRGRESIAVDLPAADDACGFEEYADAVIAALGARAGVVLVAQSLAGFTAPLVCQRADVALLVLLNAMIPRPGERAGEWWDNTGWAEAHARHAEREGRVPSAEFDLFEEFLHDLPSDAVAELLERGEPTQSGTPFEKPPPFDVWPSVPTRVLVGADDRFFPAEFQQRIATERLGITADLLPGGHLLALSRPVELADWLEGYWRMLSEA